MLGRHHNPLLSDVARTSGAAGAARFAGQGRMRSPVIGAILLTLAGGYGTFAGQVGKQNPPTPRAVMGAAPEQRRTPVVFQDRALQTRTARYRGAWSSAGAP